ncbi:MAG: ABC transporter permease [Rhodospirillaceae bacterium]
MIARIMLGIGLAFLYLPLLVVMGYSFNASRLVTVWTGFSTHWYGELFSDRQILRAAGISLLVAFLSASLATVLGTAAGYALARFGPFRGRTFLAGTLAVPLVMPEVITGLALLLLFVAAQGAMPWFGRGVGTLAIAHASLTTAYVAVIVQSRVAGMARDYEEAAADLGARPAAVFLHVTLPLIAPGLVAGWLLAFVLSLDDLVIASFVSGPQSTTLPMVVFSSVRLGVSPKINALATILVLVTLAFLAAASALNRQRRR